MLDIVKILKTTVTQLFENRDNSDKIIMVTKKRN